MKYGIYHKDCEDGTVAAIILKKAVPSVYLFPATQKKEWNELSFRKGDVLYFVDICPSPEDLVALEKKGLTCIVIDHHITAYELMTDYVKKHKDAKFNYNYYPNKSGATAVWHYFFKNKAMPSALKFIEINDLWQWSRDKNSRYINEYIKTVCRRGNLDDHAQLIKTFKYAEAAEKGKILYKRLMNDVAFIAGKAVYLDFNGKKVLAVNTEHSVSEVGHALADKAKNGIGVTYHIRPEHNIVKFSVRGKTGNAARKFAEKYGGGGHNLSSGFIMPLPQFCKMIEKNGKKYSTSRRRKS